MENSKLIQGLMRLKDVSPRDLESLIKFDLDHGINYFDTSSIYNDGESERKLGEALKLDPTLRERMIIQTKCGIYKDRAKGTCIYDLSYDAIIKSCKDSLERLGLPYVDYFLLHRPDIFMDNEEVARAFNYLYDNGMVKHFGVSNFSKEAIKYLESACKQKIEVNQLQLGIGHPSIVAEEMNFNTYFNEGIERSGDIFFYLKRKNILLQCWSPFQYGMFEGLIFNNDEKYHDLNVYLKELASKYKCTPQGIAIAFLLKLGQNVQVLIGSTNKEHVLDAINGVNVELTKDEWYKIYTVSGQKLP